MITVLAGVNGAGKSSIAGSSLKRAGLTWFNPDEWAQREKQRRPEVPIEQINSEVWHLGFIGLERAIDADTDYAFETTLGGNTITQALLRAIVKGVRVKIWYCGLESPELHIQRVAARVAKGGHNIPEAKIRERYNRSMKNLCSLAPGLIELAVYDNSESLNDKGLPPLRQLLHVVEGRIRFLANPMPTWAKPVAAVCLKHQLSSR